MSLPKSPDPDQVRACEQRILRAGRDIAELLSLDLADYPEREIKRRFLASPERADGIPDAALRRLRLELQELGAELGAETRTRLEHDELWLGAAEGDDELPGGKDLREVGAAWRALGFVDARVEALAARYRLEDDREPRGYQPPRRFVQRKYLPTLVESWLRDLATLRNLRRAAAAQREADTRRSLAERWAAADPERGDTGRDGAQ